MYIHFQCQYVISIKAKLIYKKCDMENSWMLLYKWYKMCISPKMGCQTKTQKMTYDRTLTHFH
jgi:hypothetical protein